MELIAVIILIVIVLLFNLFLYTQLKSFKNQDQASKDQLLIDWLKTMKDEVKASIDKNSQVLEEQLKSQREALNKQLMDQRMEVTKQSAELARSLTQNLNQQLNNAQEVIRNIQKQLGGIEEFGKNIKDLSDVLKAPKSRGSFGEQILYEILSSILPRDLYKVQHKFKENVICDAVVFTDKGAIPIDSKFPLDNYRASIALDDPQEREKAKKSFMSDVKKKIDDIASKYILPDEGTIENAIMYIPSEPIYYDIMVNMPELLDYARDKNVIFASPNTMTYLLKVVLVAYRQYELQKHAIEIQKALTSVQMEAQKFNGDLLTLEGHISKAYQAMGKVRSNFGKFFSKLQNAHSLDVSEKFGPESEKLDNLGQNLLIE